MIAILAILCFMSCSTDNIENQTAIIDENIPEIEDLVAFIPGTEFDNTSRGKYVGVLGHHQNPDLHGKMFINAGMDTRYKAVLQLENDEELVFIGTPQLRTNPNLIHFEGSEGSFDINFEDYKKPEVSNVFMNSEDTEGYIALVKSAQETDPLVIMGSYVDDSDSNFFGNWDLIGDPSTNTTTPFTTTIPGSPLPVSGNAISQEIIGISISHTDSTTPIIVNGDDDLDTNTAVACAPVGVMIPTTEPIIADIIINSPIPLGDIADVISAGGQTSMINGIECTWSLNYTSEIDNPVGDDIPESYINNDCISTTSGTWSWNGRTGTSTVL